MIRKKTSSATRCACGKAATVCDHCLHAAELRAAQGRNKKKLPPAPPAAPPAAIEKYRPPLRVALEKHLRELVDRPLDARALVEIEKTSKLIRDLLTVSADPLAFAASGLDMYGLGLGSGVLAPSPQSETWVMKLARELLSAYKASNQPKAASLSELLDARAKAKKQGLAGTVKKLQKQIDAQADGVVVSSDQAKSPAKIGAEGGGILGLVGAMVSQQNDQIVLGTLTTNDIDFGDSDP